MLWEVHARGAGRDRPQENPLAQRGDLGVKPLGDRQPLSVSVSGSNSSMPAQPGQNEPGSKSVQLHPELQRPGQQAGSHHHGSASLTQQ